jgi:hypothetical protein
MGKKNLSKLSIHLNISLNMETETVSDTPDTYSSLRHLIVQEDFIAYSHRGNFKSYISTILLRREDEASG